MARINVGDNIILYNQEELEFGEENFTIVLIQNNQIVLKDEYDKLIICDQIEGLDIFQVYAIDFGYDPEIGFVYLDFKKNYK